MTIDMTEKSAISADFRLAELAGRWRSPEPAQVFEGIWGIDDFWLQSPFWGIHFDAYADRDCTVRLFEFLNMGTYDLLEPNPAVPGARDADFSRVKSAIALYSPALIAAAEAAGAGTGTWRAGEWQDVSFGGCPPIGMPGTDTCPLEYDLLGMSSVDGVDRLYFGQRQADADGRGICDRRSPGLLDSYVTRVLGSSPAVGPNAGWGPAEWTRLTSSLIPDPKH